MVSVDRASTVTFDSVSTVSVDRASTVTFDRVSTVSVDEASACYFPHYKRGGGVSSE